MPSTICCFLTWIQISPEAGQEVWYFHFFQNFPQFVVIHTFKGFGIVNKAEVDVFLALSHFFKGPTDVGNLISGPLPFRKPSWMSGSSQFMYCWSLAWGILSVNASMWDEWNCVVVWAFFGIAFLWDWNENWPFPVLWHRWAFQICWHIECSTFTASSFRIWNNSTGILSPPLALLIVMLPKAHLTSHSRMSGSRWVITPSWLSGSWRSFLYSSFVYSCHLFLISFASIRCISFFSFIETNFAWNVPLVSLIFLKRSLVFPFSCPSALYYGDMCMPSQ